MSAKQISLTNSVTVLPRVRVDSAVMVVLGLTVLGAVLRFLTLDYSFYGDEFFTRYVALLPTSLSVSAAIKDTNPPLYLILMHFWARFANSEVGLRLPSMIAGVALIPVLYLLGRQLFDHRTGALAALLGAVSPFFITFSQEARCYSILALLTTTSVYFFVRLLSAERSAWIWAGYIIFTVLSIYTHYFALLLLPAESLYLLLSTSGRWPRPTWRQWVIGEAAVALALLPYLGTLSQRLGELHAGAYLDFLFHPISAIPEVLVSYTVGYTAAALEQNDLARAVTIRDVVASSPLLLPAGLAFGALTLSAILAIRAYPRQVTLLLCFLFVPIGLAFALGLFSRYAPFRAKFLIGSAPPLYLLMSLGWLQVRHRRWQIVVLAVVAVILGYSLYNYYTQQVNIGRRTDERGLAAFLAANARPGDVLLTYRIRDGKAMHYYNPGPMPQAGLYVEQEPLLQNEALQQRTSDIASSATRVWLMWEEVPQLMDDPHDVARGWLGTNLRLRLRRDFGARLNLSLYERR